jgi:hypothetical protein
MHASWKCTGLGSGQLRLPSCIKHQSRGILRILAVPSLPESSDIPRSAGCHLNERRALQEEAATLQRGANLLQVAQTE